MADKLKVKSRSEKHFIDITSKVKKFISREGIDEGLLTLYVPHTTAAVTINESADPDVRNDIKKKLKQLIPRDGSYRHREGNADSHIMSSLIGNSVQVFVQEGTLKLGTWQGIFFCEFDGPRTREIWLKKA